MPNPNRFKPVVSRISRWRVYCITLLFVLFIPRINAAPVDKLTPISTARVYPATAFEKPGDFNKSFVNILFIEQGSDIVGILIAGHTRIEVCRQLSRIMVAMYAELDDLDYEFGKDFYLGYGIFDGVVDPELSSIYNKYAQKISDINNANAGILSIQRIPLDTYRSIRSELDMARTYARNNRTTLITTLYMPRNFQTFARRFFPYGRRMLVWDDLDMAYFANYAFWNYFTLPALLMRTDIDWHESGPSRLTATFPASIPTHSRKQEFFFDANSGLLRQHNYTADIISKLARAANVVHAHGESNGWKYVGSRIVTPQSPSGGALPGPVLINIKVHDLQIT